MALVAFPAAPASCLPIVQSPKSLALPVDAIVRCSILFKARGATAFHKTTPRV